jgi:hypothetical protein
MFRILEHTRSGIEEETLIHNSKVSRLIVSKGVYVGLSYSGLVFVKSRICLKFI